jgi:hypothetical protein
MPDSRPPLTPDVGPTDPLARALAALRPAHPGLDERVLLYRAGQAAAGRELSMWRWVVALQFGLLLLVGGGAAGLLYQADAQRSAGPVLIPVPTPAPAPDGGAEPRHSPAPDAIHGPPPPPAPSPTPAAEFAGPGVVVDELADYLRQRREVMTAGLGVLPDTGPRPANRTGVAEVEMSLGLPPGVLAAPYRPNPPKSPD